MGAYWFYRIMEESDWEAWLPTSDIYVVAVSHKWYPKRRYFKTQDQFAKWAKRELGE